jgi:Cu(I)-responsive transcriptional regulator
MLSIGTLARRTGTKVQTIRYYEEIGLLPEPRRTQGGQRRYAAADLDRLAFIRHARQLGFTLETIRQLLDLADDPAKSCAEVDRIAQRQLREVERRIARLEALRAELGRMLEQCRRDTVAECRVLEVLRDHSECLTDHGAGS